MEKNIRCPNIAEIRKSAKRLAWCWPVEEVLSDKNFYLRLVMQYGGKSQLEITERYFSKEDFIESIETAPAGFF